MEVVHRGTRVQIHGNHFSRTVAHRHAGRHCSAPASAPACTSNTGAHRWTWRPWPARSISWSRADGGNSAVRKQFADHFRPSFEKRRNKFAWYGTRQRFHPVSLIFRETEHGVFIAHSYQYSPELSTFLVEVDPDTWRRAGLDRCQRGRAAVAIAPRCFAPDLGSNELLTNRSLWFEANIVKQRALDARQHRAAGRRAAHRALLARLGHAHGDAGRDRAARAAWPTTRTTCPPPSPPSRPTRRPASSSFQERGGRSLDWYENVADKLHLDPVQLRLRLHAAHRTGEPRRPQAARPAFHRVLRSAEPERRAREDHMNAVNASEVIGRSRLGGLQIRVPVLCTLCMIVDGFDVQAMGYVAPTIIKDWASRGSLGAVFGAALLGMTLGAVTMGMIADRFGRRPVLVTAMVCLALATFATAYATTVEELRWLRFLTGLCMGAIVPNAVALAGEFSPARIRITLMMVTSSGFILGGALGGIVAGILDPGLWLDLGLHRRCGGSPPDECGHAGAAAGIDPVPGREAEAPRPGTAELRAIDPTLPITEATEITVSERQAQGAPILQLFRNGMALGTLLLWLMNFMNLLAAYFLANWLPVIMTDPVMPPPRPSWPERSSGSVD